MSLGKDVKVASAEAKHLLGGTDKEARIKRCAEQTPRRSIRNALVIYVALVLVGAVLFSTGYALQRGWGSTTCLSANGNRRSKSPWHMIRHMSTNYGNILPSAHHKVPCICSDLAIYDEEDNLTAQRHRGKKHDEKNNESAEEDKLRQKLKNMTLFDALTQEKQYSEFMRLVSNIDDSSLMMNESLKELHSTILVPSNAAIVKMKMTADMNWGSRLTKQLVLYHIIPQSIDLTSLNRSELLDSAAMISDGYSKLPLYISQHKRHTFINRRYKTRRGFETRNGWLYELEDVIVVPENTTDMIIKESSYTSIFSHALMVTDIHKEIPPGATILVPDDEAFKALGERVLMYLFSHEGRKALANLLRYHIIPQPVFERTLRGHSSLRFPTLLNHTNLAIQKGLYLKASSQTLPHLSNAPLKADASTSYCSLANILNKQPPSISHHHCKHHKKHHHGCKHHKGSRHGHKHHKGHHGNDKHHKKHHHNHGHKKSHHDNKHHKRPHHGNDKHHGNPHRDHGHHNPHHDDKHHKGPPHGHDPHKGHDDDDKHPKEPHHNPPHDDKPHREPHHDDDHHEGNPHGRKHHKNHNHKGGRHSSKDEAERLYVNGVPVEAIDRIGNDGSWWLLGNVLLQLGTPMELPIDCCNY